MSAAEIQDAVLELGAVDARTAKLFSRAGMGLCQGRICGRNVLQYVAKVRESAPTSAEEIGAAQRPVAHPISLGELGDGLNKGF